jgi:CheY-like chemotaxis protein
MEPSAKKRILFVDDEANVRKVVKICLESLVGWEVLLATSGQEGLTGAETEKPDAILLDGMMPGMDGVTFLKRLQSNPAIQSIPVVFLTAKAGLTEPHRYRALGASGAIAKPFDPMTLAAEIAHALNWEIENHI